MRIALGLAVLIVVALLIMWAAPALADGLNLKALILMPGPLTASHADEESNCDACHLSLDKSAQDGLCLDCHEDVATDRQQQHGFHGTEPLASVSDCKNCHKDHKGREYNSVLLDVDTFDHIYTRFELQGKHKTVACENCHTSGETFREAPQECQACHQEDDAHKGSLGEDCAACHASENWGQLALFDHDATDFKLSGAHDTVSCLSCHAGDKYTFEATECVSCHQVSDVHLGQYGNSCDQCHGETDWTVPIFDHAQETDFSLNGAHQDLTCRACHAGRFEEQQLGTECVACHSGNDVHTGRHGQECSGCHNEKSWEKALFDHEKDTDWPLLGAHKEASCLQCHGGNLHEDVSSQCHSCHKTDDVHGYPSPTDCSSCHQQKDWQRKLGFDHELTQFPLEGLHASVPCAECHLNKSFHETEGSCDSCHRHDDTHNRSLGNQCESCHGPNAWSFWQFDHSSTTDFPLEGAHENLECASCHHGTDPAKQSTTCAACHSGDDRHDGKFGSNCGRCHDSNSFGDAQWQN